MPTFQQLIKGARSNRNNRLCKLLALQSAPIKKGTCVKIRTMKPKKPNSAIRKIARVQLTNGRMITAYIPGQGHNLQEHSVVFVRGGRTKDLPGLHYKLIRGKADFSFKEFFARKNARSKYGIKREGKKEAEVENKV